MVYLQLDIDGEGGAYSGEYVCLRMRSTPWQNDQKRVDNLKDSPRSERKIVHPPPFVCKLLGSGGLRSWLVEA